MFQVEDLRKRFGDVVAVGGVSFRTGAGEIYGLLGPNGAGKTTTMSIMSGLLAPDEGRVRFDGIDLAADPMKYKRTLGVVPQETALYEDLTGRENLAFWGGLYGLSGGDLEAAIDEALDRVELAARARDRVSTYSGGMKRRLNLALGLVHRPRAVLMDEPTVGIDPQARNNILQVIRRVADEGTTVVYTTHYLEEAEQLCDRIAILDHGRMLAEGTLGELRDRAGEEELVTVEGPFDADEAAARLAGTESVRIVTRERGRIVLATGGDGRGAVAVLSRLFEGDLSVDGISIRPPSLNGLFLRLTGRELRDG